MFAHQELRWLEQEAGGPPSRSPASQGSALRNAVTAQLLIRAGCGVVTGAGLCGLRVVACQAVAHEENFWFALEGKSKAGGQGGNKGDDNSKTFISGLPPNAV